MIKNIFAIACLLLTLNACKSGPAPDEGKEVAPGITEGNLDLKEGRDSDSGNVKGLYSINFDYDRAALNTDAKDKLAKNADYMKANPSTNLQIEGHCDSRGSIEYNLTLGERRANSVKTYLVGLGINAGRLSVLSYGPPKTNTKIDGIIRPCTSIEPDTLSPLFQNEKVNHINDPPPQPVYYCKRRREAEGRTGRRVGRPEGEGRAGGWREGRRAGGRREEGGPALRLNRLRGRNRLSSHRHLKG